MTTTVCSAAEGLNVFKTCFSPSSSLSCGIFKVELYNVDISALRLGSSQFIQIHLATSEFPPPVGGHRFITYVAMMSWKGDHRLSAKFEQGVTMYLLVTGALFVGKQHFKLTVSASTLLPFSVGTPS
eukprot:gb/GECG01015585.1/.p1 GENE.gb/GECG01015585.1/~~gb/GECG01015585.1/.p1  ORF type:complete len:127 (+),score=10.74 gb/GECG01015585.1/:1-381(+)